MTDTRYVYGARCTWHGPIASVGTKEFPAMVNPIQLPPVTLPCCPHCSGPLFEVGSKEAWYLGVAAYDAKHPGYVDVVDWQRDYPGCFPNMVAMVAAYNDSEKKDLRLWS